MGGKKQETKSPSSGCLLDFKPEYKKAFRIKLRVQALNRFYPVTRETLFGLASEGKLNKSQIQTFFTKESAEAEAGRLAK